MNSGEGSFRKDKDLQQGEDSSTKLRYCFSKKG